MHHLHPHSFDADVRVTDSSEGSSAHWLSVHLHLKDDDRRRADRVLGLFVHRTLTDLAVRRMLRRHFFVRYVEDGPHIRLRMLPTRDSREALIAELHRMLLAFNRAVADEIVELRAAEYLPETERYGGPVALSAIERHFWRSSRVVMAYLDNAFTPDGIERSRLGQSLLMMLVTMHTALGGSNAVLGMLSYYAKSYIPRIPDPSQRPSVHAAFNIGFDRQSNILVSFVEDVWNRLLIGAPLSAVLDTHRRASLRLVRDLRAMYSSGVVEVHGLPARDWDQCMQALVPSIVHMHHNRMGVTNLEEAYLAHLACAALTQIVRSGRDTASRVA